MPLDTTIASAARLDTIDQASTVLRENAARLTGLVARATALGAAADWHAPSARAFHRRIEELRAMLARAEAGADDTVAMLARVRATLVVTAIP